MFTPAPLHVLRVFAWISFVLPVVASLRIYAELYARYPGRVTLSGPLHDLVDQPLDMALSRAAVLLVSAALCCVLWAWALRWAEQKLMRNRPASLHEARG